MALTGFLLDTSVMHRLRYDAVVARVMALSASRPLYSCTMVDLEICWSATSPADYERRLADQQAAYTDLAITPAVTARALAVQRLLAAQSMHRAVSLPDLLIAATAEIHGAILMHYDADYDHIAKVTGQAVEWIVPAGSVD